MTTIVLRERITEREIEIREEAEPEADEYDALPALFERLPARRAPRLREITESLRRRLVA